MTMIAVEADEVVPVEVVPVDVVPVEVVSDPVGHISISGVHGGDELDQRLADARAKRPRRGSAIGPLLLGATVAAAVMYFFDPARGRQRRATIRDQVLRVLS